jgi:hypothetical protein
MVSNTLAAVAVLLALAAPVLAQNPDGPLVEVKVKQKHLEPLCLDGAPVARGQRSWRLGLQKHALAFTMRNEPRKGAPESNVAAGVAVIWFTPETGHKYEVEIRAPQTAYSWRVWKQGEWKPVVRDRTAERIVSTEPEWRESACGP